jgi:hypothetical protein
MKKALYVCLAGSLLLTACGGKSKNNAGQTDSAATDTAAPVTKATGESKSEAFNVSKIPVTTKNLGTFPYLSAPDGYRYNDIVKSDLETLHFAVNGKLMAVDGKTYKTNIYKNRESETPFNMQVVDEAYKKVITDLGGVQVSDKLLPGEVDKAGKSVLERENHAYVTIGENNYTLSHVRTYIIKTAQAEVWIELSLYENGGYINILQKESTKP